MAFQTTVSDLRVGVIQQGPQSTPNYKTKTVSKKTQVSSVTSGEVTTGYPHPKTQRLTSAPRNLIACFIESILA